MLGPGDAGQKPRRRGESPGPTWNAGQYLKFAEERTRPCRDLAARVKVMNPRRVIDLGCGPGNSTEVLAGRWPDAEITGLDSSPAMIETARQSQPRHSWVMGDVGEWAACDGERFDVVFSNAAMQWVPDHAVLFPRLLARANALAIQMPGNVNAPAHQLMRELAASHGFHDKVREWHAHDESFYYDVLASRAARLDIWVTEYLHVLSDAEAIVEWYKGTGLRPFLEALDDDAARERFLAEYTELVRAHYLPRADGRVLFPFRRIFVVAYR